MRVGPRREPRQRGLKTSRRERRERREWKDRRGRERDTKERERGEVREATQRVWSTPCWTTSRSRPGRRQHLIQDLRIDRSMARSMPSRARPIEYVACSGAQVFFTLQAAITCIVNRFKNWYIVGDILYFFFSLSSFFFFFAGILDGAWWNIYIYILIEINGVKLMLIFEGVFLF